jgi:hypothetical protein
MTLARSLCTARSFDVALSTAGLTRFAWRSLVAWLALGSGAPRTGSLNVHGALPAPGSLARSGTVRQRRPAGKDLLHRRCTVASKPLDRSGLATAGRLWKPTARRRQQRLHATARRRNRAPGFLTMPAPARVRLDVSAPRRRGGSEDRDAGNRPGPRVDMARASPDALGSPPRSCLLVLSDGVARGTLRQRLAHRQGRSPRARARVGKSARRRSSR